MPYTVTRSIPRLYRGPKSPAKVKMDCTDLKSAAKHIGQVIFANTAYTYLDHVEAQEIRNAIREAMRSRKPQTWIHIPTGYEFEIEAVKPEAE